MKGGEAGKDGNEGQPPAPSADYFWLLFAPLFACLGILGLRAVEAGTVGPRCLCMQGSARSDERRTKQGQQSFHGLSWTRWHCPERAAGALRRPRDVTLCFSRAA